MTTKQQIEKLRFQSKYVQGSEDECWLWLDATGRGGYGVFSQESIKGQAAHRYAYFIHYGVDPGAKHVLHKCDTPACVNPNHLELGTNLDNMRDRDAKGRGCFPGDARHPQTKLTEADYAEIRQRAKVTVEAQGHNYGVFGALAKEFGVTSACINKVCSGMFEGVRTTKPCPLTDAQRKEVLQELEASRVRRGCQRAEPGLHQRLADRYGCSTALISKINQLGH